MMETVVTLILSLAPPITAVFSIAIAVYNLIKKTKTDKEELINAFDSLKEQVVDSKQFEELKKQLEIAHLENYELKVKLEEFLKEFKEVKEYKQFWGDLLK